MKLTELFNERSLTKSEEDKKEDIVKGMKKNKGDFEKRYGKEAKAVMYATATVSYTHLTLPTRNCGVV